MIKIFQHGTVSSSFTVLVVVVVVVVVVVSAWGKYKLLEEWD